MNGAILANRRIQPAESDYYATPDDVTRALLPYLPVGITIWEPACGDGSMARVLEQGGHMLIASDLHDRGYGAVGVDFLDPDEAPHDDRYDWIVTNPPYRLADKFVRRALDTGKPFALLLKSQFWHAEKRRRLFEARPPLYVLPLTWRPDFIGGGSPTMEVHWTIWGRRGGGGATIYRPLARPR